MTVHRLLTEADSAELTQWLLFFEVEAEQRKDAAERRRFEGRILKDGHE